MLWRGSKRSVLICMIAFTSMVIATSCIFADKSISESGLELRIKQYYDNLSEKNISKCREYVLPEYSNAKREVDNEQIKHLPTIKNYEIVSIERTGNEAKVRMRTYIIENEKVIPNECYDFWVIKNNKWYLKDFCRTFGMKDEVKEYQFNPDDFK